MAFQYLYFATDNNVDREKEIAMIDTWTGLFRRRYSPAKAVRLTAIVMLELGVGSRPWVSETLRIVY